MKGTDPMTLILSNIAALRNPATLGSRAPIRASLCRPSAHR